MQDELDYFSINKILLENNGIRMNLVLDYFLKKAKKTIFYALHHLRPNHNFILL